MAANFTFFSKFEMNNGSYVVNFNFYGVIK